jgi:broad specificity phosphatase PhoE
LPIVLLLRHGQSEFNVVYSATGRDPGIIDPALTQEGRRQAAEAAERLVRHGVTRVLASPYTRALQTGRIVAEHLKAPLGIEPLVRERGAFVCDIGRPRSELEQAWPALDFGDLPEQWWHREPEEIASVAARAQAFIERAARLADHAQIAVVSHWGFILALTGQAVSNGTVLRFDPTNPGAGAHPPD